MTKPIISASITPQLCDLCYSKPGTATINCYSPTRNIKICADCASVLAFECLVHLGSRAAKKVSGAAIETAENIEASGDEDYAETEAQDEVEELEQLELDLETPSSTPIQRRRKASKGKK